MVRTTNKSRVTVPKKKKPAKKKPEKVQLVERTPGQKVEEFETAVEAVDEQPADEPTDEHPVDDVDEETDDQEEDEDVEFAFVFHGEEFLFAPVDEDVFNMLTNSTVLSMHNVENMRRIIQSILAPGEFERFANFVSSNLDIVFKKRQDWKQAGKPEGEEPQTVNDFTGDLYVEIMGLYDKMIRGKYPKE